MAGWLIAREIKENGEKGNLCIAEGLKLMPMVAETLGGWGPSAQEVFRSIARATAYRQGLDPSIAASQLYQILGIKLHKATARAILARASMAAPASGNTAITSTSRSEAALVLSANSEGSG